MTKNIKCYRCGKEHSYTYKTISEQVKCTHCNGVMRLDLSSERKVRIVRYIVVFIIALILSFVSYYTNFNNIYGLVIVIAILLIVIRYIDHLCLYLAYKFFNLNYVEFHPEDVEKAKKRRQLEKEKEKRLKAQRRNK